MSVLLLKVRTKWERGKSRKPDASGQASKSVPPLVTKPLLTKPRPSQSVLPRNHPGGSTNTITFGGRSESGDYGSELSRHCVTVGPCAGSAFYPLIKFMTHRESAGF